LGKAALKPVFIIGTCDTKGDELSFAVQSVRSCGAKVVLVDVSTTAIDYAAADISNRDVATCHPEGINAVLGLNDRGRAVKAMASALTIFLSGRKDIGAVLGIGGSGNTSIVTAAMQALPFGIPKIMLSTVASGNVAPYVGASDIMMLHSVADIAGLNAITRTVIANAAFAAAGMAMNQLQVAQPTKLPVGLTMFGVTTPAATQIRNLIESKCECFVFHATGIGGQCFEKLVDSGFLKAAIDLTTTEVADHLFGGTLPCTPDRFGAIIRTRVPYVGSVGAVDMINFGARNTVPARYENRNLYVHNPVVTLMRTTLDENRAIGEWIVERLNQMQGTVRFFLPLRGVSAIDAPGKPFHDSQANAALFDAIRKGWVHQHNRKLIELDLHINDLDFANAVANEFNKITG
jgi:uncharacterized protein (UPF0261 family)